MFFKLSDKGTHFFWDTQIFHVFLYTLLHPHPQTISRMKFTQFYHAIIEQSFKMSNDRLLCHLALLGNILDTIALAKQRHGLKGGRWHTWLSLGSIDSQRWLFVFVGLSCLKIGLHCSTLRHLRLQVGLAREGRINIQDGLFELCWIRLIVAAKWAVAHRFEQFVDLRRIILASC